MNLYRRSVNSNSQIVKIVITDHLIEGVIVKTISIFTAREWLIHKGPLLRIVLPPRVDGDCHN